MLEPLIASTGNQHTVTPPPLFKKMFHGETTFVVYILFINIPNSKRIAPQGYDCYFNFKVSKYEVLFLCIKFSPFFSDFQSFPISLYQVGLRTNSNLYIINQITVSINIYFYTLMPSYICTIFVSTI